MRYNFTGKNITVRDSLKEKFIEKFDRISKLFPDDTEVNVALSVVKLDHILEVTVNLPKRKLRAEVTTDDMYTAIDEIIDILEQQMVRYKNRLKDRSRRDNDFLEELGLYENSYDDYEGEEIEIARVKRFAIKPMDAEEAVMEMELLGHNFFVFRNAKSEEVNVVYKRKNGSYGLIDPE